MESGLGELLKRVRGGKERSSVPKTPIQFIAKRQYTDIEDKELSDFMHADFPHVTYGGGRHKQMIIEYPPAEICEPEEWKQILDKVLLPEWQEVHPLLRQRKIIVRFVEKLSRKEANVKLGGTAERRGNEEWIRVRDTGDDGSYRSKENITLVVMHELAETDFWMKAPSGEDVEVDQRTEDAMKRGEIPGYRNLLDEKIANRRALRAVRRYWPGVDWTDPEDVYEEDK